MYELRIVDPHTGRFMTTEGWKSTCRKKKYKWTDSSEFAVIMPEKTLIVSKNQLRVETNNHFRSDDAARALSRYSSVAFPRLKFRCPSRKDVIDICDSARTFDYSIIKSIIGGDDIAQDWGWTDDYCSFVPTEHGIPIRWSYCGANGAILPMSKGKKLCIRPVAEIFDLSLDND